jgi:hypothetical protein
MTSIPSGVIVYDYKIPVKGISKKVIYHISDIHLNHSDDPAAPVRPLDYDTWLKGWPWFSMHYNEPCAIEQMKRPEEHLSCLLDLAGHGDAIVMTGDICDKVSHTNMKILDSALEKVDKPWIAVCGNHDTASDIPDGYLYSRIKEPVQVLDLGDLILVGVDNSQRQITPAQTAAVQQVLDLGKPVIIVMHVPIMTDDNREVLLPCGDYFRLNHPEATEETLAFIGLLRQNAPQIAAVLAGHLHFHLESTIAPELPQFVNSQSVLGNINCYEIGE